MRVLVLGASGRTGKLAVTEALQQGYTVTALVRKTSSIQPHPNLTVVEGTPLKPLDIESAFDRTPEDPISAVIVTLAVPRESDSPFSKPTAEPYLIRDSVRNLMTVMKSGGRNVRKLVIMSLVGAGDSWANFAWPLKVMFQHTQMRWVMQDHDAVDGLVRASDGFAWTLVRSPMLKEGEAGPVRDLGEVGKGIRMLDGVTRASVAEFLVKVVGVSTWDEKPVVIAN